MILTPTGTGWYKSSQGVYLSPMEVLNQMSSAQLQSKYALWNPPPKPQSQGSVLGTSTTTKTTPTGGGGGQPPGNGGQPSDNVSNILKEQMSWEEQQAQQMRDMINREYENLIGQLTAEEQALPGRYETFKQAISAQMQPVLTSLEQAKQEKLAGLESQRAETKAQAALNLRQIHQLLADLQQRQAAALSAGGMWSSTVAPAMAEQFGRKAFESISDLQARRDRALADIAKQETLTNEFYNQKKIDFENQKAAKLNLLEQDLQDSLREIAAQKTAAAEAKARQTFEAWSNFLNNRRAIALEAAKWQQSLDMWKQQMDQQLALAKQQIASYQPQYTFQSMIPPGLQQEVPGLLTITPQGTAQWAPIEFSTYPRKPGESDEEYLKRIYGTQQTQPAKGISTWWQNLINAASNAGGGA